MPSFKRSAGFTVIELVMVLAIIAIVAVAVSPKLTDLPATRARFTAIKIRSDLRYAQMLALHSQARTRVVFDAAANTYQLQRLTVSGWTAVIHPNERNNFNVTLNTGNYDGVDITNVDLNDNQTVVFDERGRPLDGTGAALSEPALVELNSAFQIRLKATTGKAELVVL